MGFLNLAASLTAYKSAGYVVLPIPYDATTSYMGGTRMGPAAVLEASQHVELFDEELLTDPSSAGVFTAEPLRPTVSGPAEVIEQVRQAALPFLADGKFLLTLGGEHSITAGLVRAALDISEPNRSRVARRTKASKKKAASSRPIEPLGVLQIDAHSDLRDEYMGSRWSHGCVMRRLAEDCGLPISPVGIRSFSREEHDYMRSRSIEPITPADIAGDADWIGRALAKLPQQVYLTIDIDAFDPGLVPGTGTPEPGGMTWPQVTGLVRAAFREKTVVAADIVEVAPVPGSCATEYLAARLAYKLIAYREAAKRRVP